MQARAESNRQRNVDAGYGFWEGNHLPCPLQQLRWAAVTGISGTRLELGLIRHVLLDSPILVWMTVSGSATSTSVGDLLQVKRASPLAEVRYLDADALGTNMTARIFRELSSVL